MLWFETSPEFLRNEYKSVIVSIQNELIILKPHQKRIKHGLDIFP